MNVETAIATAIEYENRVRDVYLDAAGQVEDPVGKGVLNVLAREEQNHVDYLNKVLVEWRASGQLLTERLETVIPPGGPVDKNVAGLKAKLADRERDSELTLLRQVLEVETETTTYYQSMVDQLPSDVQPLFARFLEIEQGHRGLIQAEIDALSGMGFWFDMPEFDLETG